LSRDKVILEFCPPLPAESYLYLLHGACNWTSSSADCIGSITVKYRNGGSSHFRILNRRELGQHTAQWPNGLVASQINPKQAGGISSLQISKFKLDSCNNDIIAVEFQSNLDPTWLIAAATLSDRDVIFPEFKTIRTSPATRNQELKTISSFPGIAWQMQLHNGFLYLAQMRNGFSVYDVRNPEKPVMVFRDRQKLSCYCVEVIGNHVFAGYRRGWNSPGDLYGIIVAYDITNPETPIKAGSYENYCDKYDKLGFMPTSMRSFNRAGRNYLAIAGNANFKKNLSGMVVMDVTEPGNMYVCASFCDRKLGVTPHGLCMSNDNKSVITGNYVSPAKLQIFDVSNPHFPVMLDYDPGPVYRAWGVASYKNKYLYSALLGCGIAVYDIGDIKNVKLANVLFFPKQYLGSGALYDEPPLDLQQTGNYLLASNSELGYAAINIGTLPGNPCFEGNIKPQGASGIFRALTWNDRIIVFANGNNQHPAYPNKNNNIYICKFPEFMK
jgi:hypothetical protein